MKIAIDLDRTIFYCKSFLYDVANYFANKRLSKRLSYIVLDRKRVEKPSKLSKVAAFFDARKFIEIENATQVINEWSRSGIEIILLSSRPNWKVMRQLTLDCLDQHKVECSAVIIGCKNKGLFCRENQVDLLIEDGIDICRAASKLQIPTIHFSYNRPKEYADQVTAYSWKELREMVEMRAEETAIAEETEK